MKKMNSDKNYFPPKIPSPTLYSPVSSKASLLAKKKMKYFPIITSDSQSGGHTFYIATQEDDTEEEFNNNKNLAKKNSMNTMSNIKNDKKDIIPQKSVVLQIDNVKPLFSRNLNNKKFRSYKNAKTETFEKILVNKRERKTKKSNINKKKDEIIKIPTLKNITTKQILAGAKTLKNSHFKSNSNRSLYTSENEKPKNRSILDFYKLNLNSQILDKMNRNKEDGLKNYTKPLTSFSTTFYDTSSFIPNKDLDNSIEINNSSQIKNESGEKNKNYNSKKNNSKKRKIKGNSREKELIYQKYKNHVKKLKKKKK